MVYPVLGQKPNQIILTTIEKTDRTFHKKGELFLENNVTRNEIVYTFDSTTQSYTTKNYLVETYFNIWNGDTLIKERLKTKYKRWSNRMDTMSSKDLVVSLNTDIDTLEKNMSVLHTSHHYLTIYIHLVTGNDTIRYYKTKPFEYSTPWFSDGVSSVLNPNIDKQLIAILPDKFIGREKLKRVPTKSKPH